MCGRFTLRTSPSEISRLFEVAVQDLAPRYNIAPTQSIAAIRVAPDAQQREFTMLHWGLIPSWAKDRKIGYRTINARAETVDNKPSFRSSFKKRRCLVIADGFYEWQKSDAKNKQPYYIHMKDSVVFCKKPLEEDVARDPARVLKITTCPSGNRGCKAMNFGQQCFLLPDGAISTIPGKHAALPPNWVLRC